MSVEERNDPCVVEVDRDVAGVLRRESLLVLEARHHWFEDVLSRSEPARLALRAIYLDAFAVLDAVGWADDDVGRAPAAVRVPLSAGHLRQLAERRRELGHANVDRVLPDGLDGLDRAALDRDRHAAQTLDRLAAAAARA